MICMQLVRFKRGELTSGYTPSTTQHQQNIDPWTTSLANIQSLDQAFLDNQLFLNGGRPIMGALMVGLANTG